jgi:hypothetical protein
MTTTKCRMCNRVPRLVCEQIKSGCHKSFCRPAVTHFESDWRKVQKVIKAAEVLLRTHTHEACVVAENELGEAMKQLKGVKE